MPSQPNFQKPLRRSHLLLLALILGMAALLRFFSISTLGFWTDEFCSLSAAHGYGLQLDRIPTDQIAPQMPRCTRLSDALSFWKIPGAMSRQDTHPPLYFMLQRLWEDFFGDGEAAVRSLNALFSLLAIGLLFVAASASVGPSTALTACLLMAVATPQIQYSQEARNYMLVLVFALLTVIAIQKLPDATHWIWTVVLIFSLLAMMLTHYFAVGTAAGLCLYAVTALRKRARGFAATAMVISAVAYGVLWVPSILRQRNVFENSLGWLTDAAPGHSQRRLADLCRLPVRFFVEITDPRLQIVVAVIGCGMLLVIPFLFLRRPELRLWICWLIGAIAIVAMADFLRSTTQLNWVRYSLFATPAAYVLLASSVRGKWWFLPSGIAIVASLSCLFNAYIPAWKIDYKTPVQTIARLQHPGDALVIFGPDPAMDGIQFAAFQTYLPAMPKVTAVLTLPPQGATLEKLQQCPKVWVVNLYPHRPLENFEVQQNQSLSYAEIIQGRFIAVPR